MNKYKSRKTNPHRPLPEWKKSVDRDLWEYAKAEFIIKHQEDIIADARADGTKITASYTLQEGSRGGESVYKEESYVIDIDQAERTRQNRIDYRKHIDEAIQFAFHGDRDKETFISRYWWTTSNRHPYIRIALVLEALPFLGRINRNGQIVPNDNFHKWRQGVYEGLADVLGYDRTVKGE